MLNLSSIFNSWALAPSSYNSLGQDLQRALTNGSITSDNLAKLLVQNPSLANQPLPNGELPLHTLVRESQQGRELQLEKIDVLIRQGAKIDLKDTQGLTAIDHVAIFKDKELMIKILGLSIGKDLHDVQEQMELPDDIDNIVDIFADQNKLNDVDLRSLPPILQAAYQNDLSTFSVQQMIAFPLNSQKESALHYAIKGRQTTLVRQMIEAMKKEGMNINQLDICCNSLLHYAVAANASEIVPFLIEAGLPVDQSNTRKETALHFAAAAGKINLMQILVKGGASIKMLDSGGRSPLLLYAQLTKATDPLAINELQLTLAATTALYWLGQTAQDFGWQIPYQEILMPILFLATSGFELNYLLSNLNASWKQLMVLAGYLTIGWLPPFNFCCQAWRLSYLVKDLFTSCSSAWKNIRYRKWDVMCKLAVSGINTASAANSLYRSYCANKYWYDLFSKCHKVYNSEQFTQIWTLLMKLKDGDPTAFAAFPELNQHIEVIIIKLKYGNKSVFEDILGLFEFVFGYSYNYRSSAHIASPKTCSIVDPAIAALPDIMRVSHVSLIPECPKHAATILSSTFDQSRFCEEVSQTSNERQLKYINELYRNLSLILHPDKLSEEDKKICSGDLCFQKITQAKNVLAGEIYNKNYCQSN